MKSLLTRIGDYITQKQFEFQQAKFVKEQTQILSNLTKRLQEHCYTKGSPLFVAIIQEYNITCDRILSEDNQTFYTNIVRKSILDKFQKAKDNCDRQINKCDSSWPTPELFENLAFKRVDH